jgi:DNA uptake protein ComE-like DNA-binding protein
MSSVSSSPATLLADKEWRKRNGRWRWWVFLGFGFLGCVGFLIVAFRVQSKKFWTAATVASIGSAACWVAMTLSGETSDTATSAAASKTTDSTSGGGWGAGVTMAIWAAQIVYAILINREYLRWKADNRNEWYNQPVSGPVATNYVAAPPPTQPTAPQAAPFLGVDTREYFANAPAPQRSPAPPQPVPPQPVPTQAAPMSQRSTAAPVDINSASAGEIAMAVGVDDAVVRRVVDARIQRGGFSSMDDLVARAALQPHEMVRFRDKIRFGPSSTGAPTANPARTPTQPQPPTEPGTGRILDY